MKTLTPTPAPSVAVARIPAITAIILTYNEDIHIARCLESASQVASRLVVVDSFSNDATISIAKDFDADVYTRKWKSHADQFQWAIENTCLDTEWVLRLDADEYIPQALADEIKARIANAGPEISGVYLRRRMVFKGQWIKHGGYYPTILLRIWRKGNAKVEQRWMDEHVILLHGSSIICDADFVDENLRDVSHWIAKHNSYAVRNMVDFINREYSIFQADNSLIEADSNKGSPARLKRFLKDKIFDRMPPYVRGFGYFIIRYFILLGFLDGKQGLVFHFMQGCWFWMLVDANIDEARQFIKTHGLEEFKKKLASNYNIDLAA